MIEKILVPIDGLSHSIKAAEFASDLAAKYDAEIILLQVLLRGHMPERLESAMEVGVRRGNNTIANNLVSYPQAIMARVDDKNATHLSLDELNFIGKKMLSGVTELCRDKGVKNITQNINEGNAAELIIDLAISSKVDLIVMGSRGLSQLTQIIARRVGRYLERQGPLERDGENSYLTTDAVSEDPMNQLLGHSITYRIAVGPQAGRKVFTLPPSPACYPEEQYSDTAGKIASFSLHTGVAARADECKKLERFCRYISCPVVSEKRLSLTSNGNIRYQLKTPYRDGTTHVIFEPLDFMARLAALVPKPRVNLTRVHGVFAPNSNYRTLVTPAKRGKGNKRQEISTTDDDKRAKRHTAIIWKQRLKRVFIIDIAICEECDGDAWVTANIEGRAQENK